MILDKLPLDKSHHAIVGVVVFSIAIAIGLTVWLGMLVVVIVGALKELYDAISSKHTADILDFVATVSLALMVAIAIVIGGSHV